MLSWPNWFLFWTNYFLLIFHVSGLIWKEECTKLIIPASVYPPYFSGWNQFTLVYYPSSISDPSIFIFHINACETILRINFVRRIGEVGQQRIEWNRVIVKLSNTIILQRLQNCYTKLVAICWVLIEHAERSSILPRYSSSQAQESN